jgi:ATP-dependent DNA helicase RecQ
MVESWEGVDRELFDVLRAFRRRTSQERGVPPYIVFSDATLRDLARHRPTTRDELLTIHGIGAKKVAEYGDDLLAEINGNPGELRITLDAE